jgi:predicted nuclease of predicted toxin-antitoxin system
MKLLLDENIPKKLKYRFDSVFEVLTVHEMGWSGIKNGDLLKEMKSKNLKILLSLDKNISHQQNLEKFNVSLIVLESKDTRYDVLVNFIPKIEKLLSEKINSGVFIIE